MSKIRRRRPGARTSEPARSGAAAPGLIEAALRALEDGLLSTETVLRAAVRTGARFPAWLERHVAAVRSRERRKPRVRRLQWLPPESMETLLKSARKSLAGPGVVGVSWGLQYRKGRASGERALVVWVEQKVPGSALSDEQILPATFTARVAGKTLKIPVDVQAVPRGRKHGGASHVRPGKQVAVQVTDELGTLSAVLEPAAGQRAALISGHVGLSPGRAVTATPPGGDPVPFGVVQVVRNDNTVDAALIGGLPAVDLDTVSLAPAVIRDLSGDDVSIFVNALLPAGTKGAAVDAVDVPADFGPDGSMKGLLRLDHCITDPGDSGSPVTDSAGRVVGFVVGYATVEDGDHVVRSHTFVLPTRRALDVLT